MNVRASKGLSFNVQGKTVTEFKDIPVSIDHDVKCKIREGSLINMSDFKNPVEIPKPILPAVNKKTILKTVNQEK